MNNVLVIKCQQMSARGQSDQSSVTAAYIRLRNGYEMKIPGVAEYEFRISNLAIYMIVFHRFR
jgi:hypothetical protein